MTPEVGYEEMPPWVIVAPDVLNQVEVAHFLEVTQHREVLFVLPDSTPRYRATSLQGFALWEVTYINLFFSWANPALPLREEEVARGSRKYDNRRTLPEVWDALTPGIARCLLDNWTLTREEEFRTKEAFEAEWALRRPPEPTPGPTPESRYDRDIL